MSAPIVAATPSQTGAATFTATTGTATFAASNNTVAITLTAVDDRAVEGSEAAILTLTAGSSYNIGTPSAATG